MGMEIVGWFVVGGLVGWIASMFMGTDPQHGCPLHSESASVGALVTGVVWRLLRDGQAPNRAVDLGTRMTAVACSYLLVLVGHVADSRHV